ncbi:hypothetical protein BOTBODRAFT_65563 [Botryobasidium botryosum FD-172 SS1]|uniref:UBA domain-containing protein n=1 Tax=Botryobasidium botryosum (strain FD-172 SS1) TaxID=930990 RepID=A0A067MIC0_BOTB1|nr:hypothetical protein BOTBODRAFT_65563 [Botryobasidium botryosum FD-172 SS1]
MADFADLWTSSTPSTQPTIGSKLNSNGNRTQQSSQQRPEYDSFSRLAATLPSSNRSITPAGTQPARSSPALGSASSTKPTTSSDAFSSLVSLGSGSKDHANLSLADRQARAEQERRSRMEQEREALKSQGDFWDTFESSTSRGNNSGGSSGTPSQGRGNTPSLGAGTFLVSTVMQPTSGATRHLTPASQKIDPDESWDPFEKFGLGTTVKESKKPPTISQQVNQGRSSAAGSTASKPLIDDPWDLDLLATPAAHPPSSTPNAASSASSDPFDLSIFENAPMAAPTPRSASFLPKREATPRMGTPGSFDFGDREVQDERLDGYASDDDILGALAKPMDANPSRASPSNVPAITSSPTADAERASRPSPKPQSRTVSPPPHIIGQIVEMGFSPQQARTALASTATGVDVQAALESLLQSSDAPRPEEDPERIEREREREEAAERRRRRRAGPSRESTRQAPAQPAPEAMAPILDTDKIIAQASEIGLSVFNRANAFWAQGKAQVQKAYEERRAASAASVGPTSGPPADGRPRWMQEEPPRRVSDGAARRTDEEQGETSNSAARPPPPTEPARRQGPKTGSLLSDDAPTYVSPGRRKAPVARERTSKRAPEVPSAPPPLRHRAHTSTSPEILARSTAHRTKGTEFFKLGRFAEAESSYTSAIDLLPSGHLGLVPLLNNRALSRIKTGDHSGAAQDATAVIEVIGVDYHPDREAPLPAEVAEINLGDALVKALSRRANAYEMAEKWDKARDDWEKLAGINCGPAGSRVRDEAVRGAGRCRKMVGVIAGTESAAAPHVAPKPKPRPKPAPRPAMPSVPSEALTKLRSANEAQEAEDQMRHNLKDVVDAKILAWKGGKEANLRALIASLDTVLWSELGWQKVGMGDLITPSQVKIRYTKAIAKLHPDKLNPNNTTLEQRMIANGVFGSLNEAWLAFKP